MDNILTFIGLMKKAGALAIGADHAGESAQRGQAKLFCTASDAAENTCNAVRNAARERGTPIVTLEHTKAELGAALGQKECATVAITNAGFARALSKKLGLEIEIRMPRAPDKRKKTGQKADSRRPAAPGRRTETDKKVPGGTHAAPGRRTETDRKVPGGTHAASSRRAGAKPADMRKPAPAVKRPVRAKPAVRAKRPGRASGLN